jgi:hypothetical protein
MEWENVPEQTIIDDAFGFVYLIERLNALPGEKMYYWGCKQFHFTVKRPPKKGKLRKRKIITESDWKMYWGSSNELLFDIKSHGEDNFKRTILTICYSKWHLKYEELLVQMSNNVLLRDDVYNGIVSVRLNKIPQSIRKYYIK